MPDRFKVRPGSWRLRLLALACVAAAGVAHGKEWRVGEHTMSLAETVAQASAGDRISVARGHYRGPLRLDKSIVLEAEEGAMIEGDGDGNVLTLTAPGISVRGFTLRGSGSDLTEMDAVVFVRKPASGARIADNRIESTAFGIWVDGAADVAILGNRVQGDASIRSQDRGNGIHLFNATGAVVADNEIWETRDGIYIDSSNRNVLRGNHLHHLRYGIHYMYSYHNEVIDNRTDHTRTGYALMQSKYLTVKGNRSDQDTNYGILMNYIVYSKIEDNIVTRTRSALDTDAARASATGTEGKAIFIYNCLYNKIRGNTFARSGIGVHLTAGSEDNSLYNNAFIRNRIQVKYVANRAQEWSSEGKGNFWSDYLGWDLNADGIGDKAYQPNDGVDQVLWKYPAAKVLMNSPAVNTLHWVQEQFPVLRPPGVRDSFPLMKNPAGGMS